MPLKDGKMTIEELLSSKRTKNDISLAYMNLCKSNDYQGWLSTSEFENSHISLQKILKEKGRNDSQVDFRQNMSVHSSGRRSRAERLSVHK